MGLVQIILLTHVTQKGKIRHEDSKAQRFHQEKHILCEDFVSLCLSFSCGLRKVTYSLMLRKKYERS